MKPLTSITTEDIASKIKKLVEEKGWNQEDFARISNLNRHTVRQILTGNSIRRLRNATICQCAEAFGLTVNELRSMPIDRLLLKIHGKIVRNEQSLQDLLAQVELPELKSWIEKNPERIAALADHDLQELMDAQGPSGQLERFGVEPFVKLLERRRSLLTKVHRISRSSYLDCLEQLVELMHEKVERTQTPD